MILTILCLCLVSQNVKAENNLLTINANKMIEKNHIREVINQYAWKKRQLIVFSPSIENKQYQHFSSSISTYRLKLKERKLHTWHIVKNDSIRLNNQIRADITNRVFRDYFNIQDHEFRIILVGYDQEEKLRQNTVDFDILFSKIDQMPMRIRELQLIK